MVPAIPGCEPAPSQMVMVTATSSRTSPPPPLPSAPLAKKPDYSLYKLGGLIKIFCSTQFEAAIKALNRTIYRL